MCGRYEDAVEILNSVLQYYSEHTDIAGYDEYCLCLYENMAKAYLCQKKLAEAMEFLDRIHEKYSDSDDSYTMVTALCTEAMYYHMIKDDIKCDKIIARIHKATTPNIPILDLFEEYYDYCKILLERDQQEEFWHIIDSIEPLVKRLDFIKLQMRLIGLKIQFYRKYGHSPEYLQAAGLYYELSERAEAEMNAVMNSVLNIRKNLELVNLEKQQQLLPK